MQKFIPNRIALITMLAACAAILVSMGLRQTFGLFFSAFEEGLNCTRTEFGLAIGIQMLFWGLFAPIFGLLADKFGGSKSVFIGFVIFGIGIYMLYSGPNTGIYFQISLGVLVGTYSSIYVVANMLMSLTLTQDDLAIPEPEGAEFDELP